MKIIKLQIIRQNNIKLSIKMAQKIWMADVLVEVKIWFKGLLSSVRTVQFSAD
jgi:hypothetical protein